MNLGPILFVVGVVGLGFVVANSSQTEGPLIRKGPGGSKFVKLPEPEPERETWRMPTYSEFIIYANYYLGGFDDVPGAEEKGPAEIHGDMVDNVRQSLEMAEEFGHSVGPTLFDADLERTATPAPRLPQIKPDPWSDF